MSTMFKISRIFLQRVLALAVNSCQIVSEQLNHGGENQLHIYL
jgi:hypothetical protein